MDHNKYLKTFGYKDKQYHYHDIKGLEDDGLTEVSSSLIQTPFWSPKIYQ
jgi:hypothetical protein